ncbi:MAG: hypothetical protein ACRBG0_09680 [Lewinella sp.]|jgi:hypothetical protein|uniref:hypothetical protein n=1 Tax=Lewinella sp. TaxID=2004506 RepID=UPI003D6B31BE
MIRFLYFLFFGQMAFFLAAQSSPLPPLNSNPVWEIRRLGFEVETSFDTITYGQHYCNCGHDYVGVVLNGEEEFMYLRQSSTQAYFLEDINDCASERLLYDYTVDTARILINNILGFPDSLDVFPFVLTPFGTPGGPMQLTPYRADYSYLLGPWPVQGTTTWIRGVGDNRHPFFPIFNNFSPVQEFTYGLQRLTVDHTIWYDATPDSEPYHDIIYVDQDATSGQQNGTSWEDAHTDLNTALQLADAGDMIWVAEGTYRPTAGADRGASFVLRNGIQLFGGFAGIETYLAERENPELHPTVLSGDIGIPADSTDNSYHVIRIQDISDFALVDGFTIRDGNALGGTTSFPFTEEGGGILIYSGIAASSTAQITLKNNTITANTAKCGGAISIDDGVLQPIDLNITQCNIAGNAVPFRGGGLYIPYNLTALLEIKVTDTEFNANRYQSFGGGAIYDDYAGTNWSVVNTAFINNGSITGGSGGAWNIFHRGGTKRISILNSIFRDNYCVGNGAGIEYIHNEGEGFLILNIEKSQFLNNRSYANSGGGLALSGLSEFNSAVMVTECDFLGNRSLTLGGAFLFTMLASSGETLMDVDRCRFINNQGGANLGGAIRFSVGTSNSMNATTTSLNTNIQNSLFLRNRGVISQGNESYDSSIQTTVSNCTFVDNGLVIFSKPYTENFNDSTFRNNYYIRNSIIWEPTLPLWQILYNGDPQDLSVFDYELDHCLISVDSCDLPGGVAACHTLPNLFNVDPLFVDVENDEYQLKGCSPLLNQGVSWPYLRSFDLDKNPRIQEGLVDLGAYETVSFINSVDDAFLALDCAMDSTGSISLNTVTGYAPSTYTLTGNDVFATNTVGAFTNLPAGNYQLTTEDGQSCTDTLDFEIVAPPPIELGVSIEPFIEDTQPGTINVDSISGGTMPYQVFFEEQLWDGEPLTNLAAGEYLLTVLDDNGCALDTIVEIDFVNSTSDQPHATLSLSIAPNPVVAQTPLQINKPDGADISNLLLELWTVNGQKLLEKPLVKHDWPYRLMAPSRSGIYLLVLKDRDGRYLYTTKLVVMDH